MSQYNEIKLEAARLGNEETTRGLTCPFCHGGLRNDKSFYVTRKGNLGLYICHRATCGKKGAVSVNGYFQEDGYAKGSRTFIPRNYTSSYRPPTGAEYASLRDRYGVSEIACSDAGIFVEVGHGRLGVPIMGPYHAVRRGIYTRGIPEYLVPTNPMSYIELDEPWMGWFVNPDETFSPVIVLVEDVISAIRVSKQYTAVALMGTNLTYEMVKEISEFQKDRVVLCLDKDATQKAYEYRHKYAYCLRNFSVAPLSKDLKYETDEEIKRIINAVL
jgi:hypothetical protein